MRARMGRRLHVHVRCRYRMLPETTTMTATASVAWAADGCVYGSGLEWGVEWSGHLPKQRNSAARRGRVPFLFLDPPAQSWWGAATLTRLASLPGDQGSFLPAPPYAQAW